MLLVAEWVMVTRSRLAWLSGVARTPVPVPAAASPATPLAPTVAISRPALTGRMTKHLRKCPVEVGTADVADVEVLHGRGVWRLCRGQ